jgi:hypothetical protein
MVSRGLAARWAHDHDLASAVHSRGWLRVLTPRGTSIGDWPRALSTGGSELRPAQPKLGEVLDRNALAANASHTAFIRDPME